MLKTKTGLFSFVFILVLFACVNNNTNKNTIKNQKKEELIIYCENAVAPPINELIKKFEKEFGCKITIRNDCVQNLIGLINYSHRGDIFIPSSIHSFEVLRKGTTEELTDSVFLGYNSLVFMVKKGNPQNFNGDVSSLTSDKFAVIIANPETSSLGYETQKILIKWNIYEDVLNHVVALSADSKGLIKSLKNNRADIVINFASTIFINGSRNFIDIIPFDEEHRCELEVYAGILSTSENVELARSFMQYMNNPEGISVFNKYGFSKRKSLIF